MKHYPLSTALTGNTSCDDLIREGYEAQKTKFDREAAKRRKQEAASHREFLKG